MAKILLFDIEICSVANGMKADTGWVMCVGYKWLDEDKVYCMKQTDYTYDYIKNPTDDSALLKDFLEVYKQADAVVAHYGAVFDRRYLEGRLIINGLPPLPDVKLIDTCLIARSKFLISSNSLKNLAKVLGCDNQKSESNFPAPWFEIARGGKRAVKAIKFIAEYCKQDVLTLESVYLKMRSRISQHPHVGVINGLHKISCQKCGHPHLKRNGIRYTAAGAPRQEYQCKKCHGYMRLPLTVKNS